jgi:hypothetical protein
MPDGSLIGAYVVDEGADTLRVTDDGDLLFSIATSGGQLNKTAMKRFSSIAARHDFALVNGNLETRCAVNRVRDAIANLVQAACVMGDFARISVERERESFEHRVGAALTERYGNRLARRVDIKGVSGHVAQFQFALDFDKARPTLIQTIPAVQAGLNWGAVWGAGGKMKDIAAARPDIRLVAILEAANDVDDGRRFFADVADVAVFPLIDGLAA